MIKKIMSVLLLLSVSVVAMENTENNVTNYNFPITRAIESSSYGWRSLISHAENRLAPIVPVSMITNREIALPYIPYHDVKKGTMYYAFQSSNTDNSYSVVNSNGDVIIKLPFQPRHLALNHMGTLMLIEGWEDTQYDCDTNTLLMPNNNALMAYALVTKKMYHLYDYKALHGHKTSFIGFKEGSSTTAIADFALSHQEWDLSGPGLDQ